MTESLQALINFAFQDLKLNSHFKGNEASGMVMQKEATLIKEYYRHAKFHDVERYYVLNTNLEGNN